MEPLRQVGELLLEAVALDPRLNNRAELNSGDAIFDAASGTWIRVYSMLQTYGNHNVYDLRVTKPNNFTANGILLLDKV